MFVYCILAGMHQSRHYMFVYWPAYIRVVIREHCIAVMQYSCRKPIILATWAGPGHCMSSEMCYSFNAVYWVNEIRGRGANEAWLHAMHGLTWRCTRSEQCSARMATHMGWQCLQIWHGWSCGYYYIRAAMHHEYVWLHEHAL